MEGKEMRKEISTTPYKAYELYKWAKNEVENGDRRKATKIQKAYENTIQKMSDYDRWRTEKMIRNYEREMFFNKLYKRHAEHCMQSYRLKLEALLCKQS
jgi:uncharacterized protein